MHPREGWTEDRRAGGLSRRGFLTQGAAAGLLAAGAGSLLAGCSSGTTTTSGAHAAAGIPLPRPNNPVTWPVSKDNPAIKSGLAPEQNATLRLFNWVAYINPDCLKAFGK
jgi:spermidine/putrescine transport system substrate-binding protein